jgi:hypothetical protein
MKLTSQLLREIVEEEIRYFSEAGEVAAEGGDQQAAPVDKKEKDVERAESKLEQHLTTILKSISSEKEFAQLMTSFLEMASKHPGLKTAAVRRTLIGLAKRVQEADTKKG